ncbi:type II toxin-antitoxin system HicB family antitoxin [Desulfosarcina sp.]|uniref:type II toxin-antitoxin system HicB family antitoxin n=1 Tax=Desulfosarcina sp. TaxID=2027861 RepID=UPI0029BB5E5B|nr:type II toxin-antitoxin system HicB family antitoxin [Desulfosarcina sp.]MDX2451713.1 type II toxin-antitoxin system HicB family antitoxin [Desulfosarcina sp.]MDX2489500.1 type II toxin-antitoxin system HicB family antitoxin [Desulfosarcina sp.]
MKKYTLIYWQDGKWLVGRLRERNDVFSQGMTLSELEINIQEALNLMEETDFENLPPGFKVKEMTIETR